MAMLCASLVLALGCNFNPPEVSTNTTPDAAPMPDAPPPPDAALLPDAPPQPACASDPAYTTRDGTTNLYAVSTTRLLWADAAALCASTGAYLITVDNNDENEYVRDRIDSDLIWIGLNDLQTEGMFEWHGGQDTDFRLFSANEPNGGTNENCGEIREDRDGRWNDAQCEGDPRHFMCECEPVSQ